MFKLASMDEKKYHSLLTSNKRTWKSKREKIRQKSCVCFFVCKDRRNAGFQFYRSQRIEMHSIPRPVRSAFEALDAKLGFNFIDPKESKGIQHSLAYSVRIRSHGPGHPIIVWRWRSGLSISVPEGPASSSHCQGTRALTSSMSRESPSSLCLDWYWEPQTHTNQTGK